MRVLMQQSRRLGLPATATAIPHPSLPTNTLYRHIKADDPPAIRFRTLVTWSLHRLKEGMRAKLQDTQSDPAVRQAAVKIADALIKDVAEKRIDLSWAPEDGDVQVCILLRSRT